MKFSNILLIASYVMVLTAAFVTHKIAIPDMNNRLDNIELAICEAQEAIDGTINWNCKKGHKK